MTSTDSGWMALALQQDGVVSRAQLRAAGHTDKQIQYGVRQGRWSTVFPGVFQSALVPLTPRGRVRAAWLWGGQQSTISGWSAAWWWQLTDLEPPVPEIIVPRRTRRTAPAQLRVTRRDLLPGDQRVRGGLVVTSLPLSALQGAVALGRGGPAVLDRALQRTLSYRELHAVYCRQIGWRGSAAAHLLMAAAGDGAAAISERLMIALLKGADLHGWRINRSMRAGTSTVIPDFRFDKERLVLEIDGWAWHHQRERFQLDRARQNDIQLDGWLVLRFTWYDLVDRPAESLDKVRRGLRRAG